MINYSMKYGVAESARLLEVDRETLKNWTHVFSEYLSPSATPDKGKPRFYSVNDLRVFAFILLYWEEEPDIEYIKNCLNANSQFEYENIDIFIASITPLFRAMPEDIDETWRGVVFGGDFALGDLFATADSFKLAGDKLVEIARDGHEERELFQPVIYNYRHATELYIKAVIGEQVTHNLRDLMATLRVVLKSELNAEPPVWFENIIEAFDYSDPKGTAFRYGETVPNDELYADMHHIKKLMNWLSDSFKQIQIRRHRNS